MKMRVLITCPPMLQAEDGWRERFRNLGIEVIAPEIAQQLSEAELLTLIGDVDGVIAGDDPFTACVLEKGRAGRLKVLVKWGIGVDAIDLQAANRLGIVTANTPNVFGEEVADVAIGYAIMLVRQLHRIDTAVRVGQWLKIRGRSLHGMTAGIIGVGSIGRALALRCAVMGMPVLGYDVAGIPAEMAAETGLRETGLMNLLADADIVFLTCSLSDGNRHFMDADAFGKMKRGAYIINVARGALIRETALQDALDNGVLAGAALDVFEREPLDRAHPLCGYQQVILGSHNSSNTADAVTRVNNIAINILLKALEDAKK